MRPVFVGNFEYDTRQSDLERLFSKYGRVERVDMKSGNLYYFSILPLSIIFQLETFFIHFDFLEMLNLLN